MHRNKNIEKSVWLDCTQVALPDLFLLLLFFMSSLLHHQVNLYES